MVISDDILNLLQPTPDFGSYIYSKAMVNVDRTQVSVTSSAGIITLTRNSNSSVIGRVVKMSSTEAKFEAYDSLDGSPLRTITLALVSGGIQVTDSRDPSNPVIYGGAALGYGWTKSGDGVSESGESVINSSGEREETITSTAGTSVKRIYRFGYGPATQTHELLTAVVMDSGAGGLNLTTSYEYWDSGIQINRLKRVINPDGSWICYTFGRDASRYYEREYSPTAGNATSPVPDDAMLSSYDSGTGFDGRKVVRTYIDSLAEARLESEIEWINSNRVSRTEYEYSGTATTTITEIEKKFIDSTNYLATKSVRYGANLAADQWKAGRIISQGGPDYNIDSCKSSGSC